MPQNEYRIEKKYVISLETAVFLKERFGHLMKPDEHAIGDAYRVRSLYFDTPDADAFLEKMDGEPERNKYRLRFYNGDTSFIRLEKKEKRGEMTRKSQTQISSQIAHALQLGEYEQIRDTNNPLCMEFYSEAVSAMLKPSAVIDYLRFPFAYDIDNVRITIDTDVRAGAPESFFQHGNPPFPVLENRIAILEIKTDDRLPLILGRLLESIPRQQQSCSKYALGFALLHSV